MLGAPVPQEKTWKKHKWRTHRGISERRQSQTQGEGKVKEKQQKRWENKEWSDQNNMEVQRKQEHIGAGYILFVSKITLLCQYALQHSPPGQCTDTGFVVRQTRDCIPNCQVLVCKHFHSLTQGDRRRSNPSQTTPTHDKHPQLFPISLHFVSQVNITPAFILIKREPPAHWKRPKNLMRYFIRTVFKWASWGELTLPDMFLPPGACLPKSAKAGVKSGPRGRIRGSRVLSGNFGWLICAVSRTHKRAAQSCWATRRHAIYRQHLLNHNSHINIQIKAFNKLLKF